MNDLKLAWRNIWRNKRRTLLTVASIFLAIFLALIVRSLQVGWFDRLIEITVNSYTGHIQLHKKGYWVDKDINNSMVFGDSLTNLIQSMGNVDKTVPRLEYFALSSFRNQTKGVMLMGTNPGMEDEMTHLAAKVTKGSYLTGEGEGILVAEGLATYLGLTAGDTLVLIGQGYHGTGAAGKFPVSGLVRFPSPQLNNQVVFMNLPLAQDFFSTENRITSLSITLKNADEIENTLATLRSHPATSGFEVMRWDEMMTELMQTLKVKTAGGMIILSILYMIVGFGIFGTVIMMTNERLREFGVVISVGMQKSRLAAILVMEMLFIGLTGILSGVVGAMPILVWYHFYPLRLGGEMGEAFINFGIEPLMPLALKPGLILSNVMVVVVIVLVTSIYPVRKILKLKVAEALHQ